MDEQVSGTKEGKRYKLEIPKEMVPLFGVDLPLVGQEKVRTSLRRAAWWLVRHRIMLTVSINQLSST